MISVATIEIYNWVFEKQHYHLRGSVPSSRCLASSSGMFFHAKNKSHVKLPTCFTSRCFAPLYEKSVGSITWQYNKNSNYSSKGCQHVLGTRTLFNTRQDVHRYPVSHKGMAGTIYSFTAKFFVHWCLGWCRDISNRKECLLFIWLII